MGICPIASKVGHVTLATPPLGSIIVPYVVLDMAYPTKKKPFKSYGVRGPKILKKGHVTLATPTYGSFLIHYVVLAAVDLTKKNAKILIDAEIMAQNRNPRWRPSAILDFRKSDF